MADVRCGASLWQVEIFGSVNAALADSSGHRNETLPLTFGQLLALLASPNPEGALFRRFFNDAIAAATSFGGAITLERVPIHGLAPCAVVFRPASHAHAA